MNPDQRGTKAAAHYVFQVPAGGRSASTRGCGAPVRPGLRRLRCGCRRRRAEADEFYAVLQEGIADADERLVQRQAFAGMIWSKQFYHYDVARWLTAIRRNRRRRKNAPRAATPTGATSTTPT